MIDLLFSAGCAASAAMFTVDVERVSREGERALVLVKASNQSDCPIDRIIFECTFFDADGDYVTVAHGRVRRLPPMTHGFDEVPKSGENLHSVACVPTTVMDRAP